MAYDIMWLTNQLVLAETTDVDEGIVTFQNNTLGVGHRN
ncbi:hypothetical protein VIB_001670 [Vibrio metschnikovii CIP 69.14]|nr:hypothetical protein VIB_001670 [Vibrio metschnikovii CIP 69.14]